MIQDQKTEWSAREHQARAHLWDLRAKVQLLESRVLDADARHAVAVFVAISQLAIPMGKNPAQANITEVSERYHDAIERLGKLIRERY
jgi:hypothetical protein